MALYKKELLFVHINKSCGGIIIHNFIRNSERLLVAKFHRTLSDMMTESKKIGLNTDNITKFTIVRNPFDRMVSMFLFYGKNRKKYKEFFSGYEESPEEILSKTFEDVQGYEDLVMLKDVNFNSHCEHHMVPIQGKVHLAYIPTKRVVGISKLARTVDIFARRLQTQETMTQQIAECINSSLKPKGVAVYIEAFHQCMTTRGVMKPNVSTITNCFIGDFKTDSDLQQRFTSYILNR